MHDDQDPARHCYREESPTPACLSCGRRATEHTGCDCDEPEHPSHRYYNPDGNPIEPRTTAAEEAQSIAGWRATVGQDRKLYGPRWTDYRGAAAYEGDRYAEALRGAAELRRGRHDRATDGQRTIVHTTAGPVWPHPDRNPNDPLASFRAAAWTCERRHGLPCHWNAR